MEPTIYNPNVQYDQQALARAVGIHFPQRVNFISDEAWLNDFAMAADAQPDLMRGLAIAMGFDAQPTMITNPNAGIPSILTTWIDPKIIEVLVAPMNAAKIFNEVKKGDWLMDAAIFPMVESKGVTTSYDDFSNAGMSTANSQFPQRNSYHYQTNTRWGQKELARQELAKIDWVSRLNIASILILNKFQNLTYFFGVSGPQYLYGVLNDPSLPSPITPATKAAGGVTWAVATAYEIYSDILNLFVQLQIQNNGLITRDTKMTLAMSSFIEPYLAKVSTYNVAVSTTIKQNFPNLTVKVAPEYNTASGELMQMIVDDYEGQDTAQVAFTEKMRAHAIEVKTSSWEQKKSQGTWGGVIYRPVMFAQMLGM